MQAALLQLAQAFVRGMFTPDLDHLSERRCDVVHICLTCFSDYT
jgi:hypothetical protein